MSGKVTRQWEESKLEEGEIYCPKFRESKKMRDKTRFMCKLS